VYRLLLAAGGAAAALGSIVALLLMIVDRTRSLWTDDRPAAVPRPAQIRLSLGVRRPEQMTFDEYLTRERLPKLGQSAGELARRGGRVAYHVDVASSARGKLPVRMTLLERRDADVETASYCVQGVRASCQTEGDKLDLQQVAHDQCTCTEFVALPRRRGIYRVDVEIMPVRGSSPLAGEESPWFTSG